MLIFASFFKFVANVDRSFQGFALTAIQKIPLIILFVTNVAVI